VHFSISEWRWTEERDPLLDFVPCAKTRWSLALRKQVAPIDVELFFRRVNYPILLNEINISLQTFHFEVLVWHSFRPGPHSFGLVPLQTHLPHLPQDAKLPSSHVRSKVATCLLKTLTQNDTLGLSTIDGKLLCRSDDHVLR